MNKGTDIAAIVSKAKADDLSAMRALYDGFAKEMLSASLRITNSLVDTQDIIQESFLHSFQKLGQLQDEGKYGSWLKRIVINNSIKFVKQRRSFDMINAIDKLYVEENEEPWFYELDFDLIKMEIQKLPNGSREIFSLYLLEEYTHPEIAMLLGVSVSNSKSQYRYAIKLLRTRLMHLKV